MARCEQCGAELPAKTWFTRYCTKCGTKVPGDRASGTYNTYEDMPLPSELRGLTAEERAERAGVKLGFSDRFDTEEFQEAMGKANRTYGLVMVGVALLLAPLVTLIAGLIKPQNTAILLGAGVIVEIIVVIVVICFVVKRLASRQWDGEVVAQDTRVTRSRSGVRNTTWITTCMTSDGKRRKHKETDRPALYNYLEVGDEVRYHPKLHCPLEKYDKTHDTELVCPFCGLTQPIENDYCGGCGKPMLK